ncbi:MAG: hypothetical protein PF517_12920 [Salinivirgaceae bacterium]|jgi:hypothetical protein|nr:hypothetical protein [Salinivirgaceae bacterium]
MKKTQQIDDIIVLEYEYRKRIKPSSMKQNISCHETSWISGLFLFLYFLMRLPLENADPCKLYSS